MKFHFPVYPLNQFIEYFFHYEDMTVEYSKEKLLPDGAVELIINLTEISRKLYDNQNPNKATFFQKAWISGMREQYILIEAAKKSSVLVVRFKPGGAYPFLRMPVSEIKDQVLELELIFGSRFAEIWEQLMAAPTSQQKFVILEDFFLQKAHNRLEINPVIQFSIEELAGSTSLKTITSQTGYSQKHLIQLFRQHVGLTPKVYARIMRFQEAIHSIEANQQVSWIDLALHCGYYDQAHFINEFRAFSGINPSVYLVEKGEFINYIPID